MLVAARLDRITRRAHTLSQLLEDGYSIRAADMPGADDLMMRIYAAMAQKERELISERTKAALAAARARGKALGGDRGYRPSCGPDAALAAVVRQEEAERTGHRLALEVEALRETGVTTMAGLAQALTERGVPTPRGSSVWTHTTVARVLKLAGAVELSRLGCYVTNRVSPEGSPLSAGALGSCRSWSPRLRDRRVY